jgi:hypothetical protein
MTAATASTDIDQQPREQHWHYQDAVRDIDRGDIQHPRGQTARKSGGDIERSLLNNAAQLEAEQDHLRSARGILSELIHPYPCG